MGGGVLVRGEGALVADEEASLLGLAEDDAREVDSGVLAADDGLARRADDGVADAAVGCEDGELGEDILVELRQELEADIAGDAGVYLALGRVLNLEVVLRGGVSTRIFSGSGCTLKELDLSSTLVSVTTR